MQIRAFFDLSRKGLIALQYAADFSRRLPGSELVIMYRPGDDQESVLRFCQEQLFGDNFCITLERLAQENLPDTLPTESILICCRHDLKLPQVNVIYPVEEAQVRGDHIKICFPFGNGSTGPYAAKPTFALAKDLKAALLLVHTTWRNPECKSESAEDHMIAGARYVLNHLKEEAGDCRLELETVIAAAEDVPRFIIETANLHGCQLIAMARRHLTLRGGYVDEVIRQTNIPVLAIGRR